MEGAAADGAWFGQGAGDSGAAEALPGVNASAREKLQQGELGGREGSRLLQLGIPGAEGDQDIRAAEAERRPRQFKVQGFGLEDFLGEQAHCSGATGVGTRFRLAESASSGRRRPSAGPGSPARSGRCIHPVDVGDRGGIVIDRAGQQTLGLEANRHAVRSRREEDGLQSGDPVAGCRRKERTPVEVAAAVAEPSNPLVAEAAGPAVTG